MTDPTAAPPDDMTDKGPEESVGGSPQAEGAYRVLARKYRPQSFADMIGQEALVRTLRNAIETGRLPHAIILTGVRGVGKTTTARIIAKAINYAGPEGTAGPTVGATDDCPICQAIAEDRHPDVIEMDAASRTGVEDVRELIEGVRYKPVSARYKVYIIDEVHMLSRHAFNALLKTLEEPPEHTVFIFATTEIRKVPVTVLSRCMRFDLRRVEQQTLAAHFARVCEKEGVTAESEALELIARAADGSVRDGLSLLDQAIALAEGRVAAASVKDMLGLADRTRVYDLFDAVMKGEIAAALAILRDLYNGGSDPLIVLQDLLALCHSLTRAKLVPENADSGLPEAERVRARDMAAQLSLPVLSRTWQMLLKGLGETQSAPSPLQAAEMVLIRLAHASDLPSPAELVRRLEDAGDDEAPATTRPGSAAEATRPPPTMATAAKPPAASPSAQTAPLTETQPPEAAAEPPATPRDFPAVVELLRTQREVGLANHLVNDVHLVAFEVGRLEIRPTPRAPRDLAGRLGAWLGQATGRRWLVSISDQPGAPTLADTARARDQELKAAVLSEPLVQAVLASFPGAEIHRIGDDEGLASGDEMLYDGAEGNEGDEQA